MNYSVSIVIPVLNEAEQLADKLQALQQLRKQCQLILVDGGSSDGSPTLAAPLVDKVLHGAPGRAGQMNLGAAQADADLLLFLHADTRLPANAISLICQASSNGYPWGRFDVSFDNQYWLFKLIAWMMNYRSCLTGIATGDQCLFVSRQAFQSVGGFPDIALMEDIAISRKLKMLSRPCCVKAKVLTSARRWQQNGILTTIGLMWCLRLAFFCGVNPNILARLYYRRS